LIILTFKEVRVEDRTVFESYLSRPGFIGSECAFTNLFLWRDIFHTYWTIAHDFLVIKVQRGGINFMLQPFGGRDEDLPRLLDELREYHNGSRFEFHGIYECSLERLRKVVPDAEFIEDRDNWDYVYLRDDLANMSGRRYHGQKNHYNAFRKAHPDYVFEFLNPDNFSECLAFGEEWCEQRADEDASVLDEMHAIREAFVNFKDLGLEGGAIRVNGKIEAFSFGKRINAEVADLHVEKANPEVRGLFVAINKECAEKVWTDLKYLNREEDMGNPGLRKAKEDLHPVFMVKKYNLYVQ